MQTSNVETLLVGGEHSVGRGILVQLQRWLTHAFVHAPRMVSVTKRRPPSSRVVTGRRLFLRAGAHRCGSPNPSSRPKAS